MDAHITVEKTFPDKIKEFKFIEEIYNEIKKDAVKGMTKVVFHPFLKYDETTSAASVISVIFRNKDQNNFVFKTSLESLKEFSGFGKGKILESPEETLSELENAVVTHGFDADRNLIYINPLAAYLWKESLIFNDRRDPQHLNVTKRIDACVKSAEIYNVLLNNVFNSDEACKNLNKKNRNIELIKKNRSQVQSLLLMAQYTYEGRTPPFESEDLQPLQNNGMLRTMHTATKNPLEKYRENYCKAVYALLNATFEKQKSPLANIKELKLA